MKILTWIEVVLTILVVAGFVMIAPKAAWVHEHPYPADPTEQLLKQHYESLGHFWEIGIYYPWALFTAFYLLVCVIFVVVQMLKRLTRKHNA
jgi:uncharacterized membrane protein